MTLIKLLYFHTFITLMAGLILFVSPSTIPNVVDISIDKSQYLLCYFLGSAEIAIAFLSFKAIKMTDKIALKIVVQTIIIFHLLTAFAEGFAFVNGTSSLIIINIFVRLSVSALFYQYGLKPQTKK